jgi:hypothetical protein
MGGSLRSLRRGLAALLAGISLLAGPFAVDGCPASEGAACDACPSATTSPATPHAIPSAHAATGDVPAPDDATHSDECGVACAVVTAALAGDDVAERSDPWRGPPRADRADAPASATRASDPPPPRA